MPTTFLLITLLCVLSKSPVGSKKVKLKHVHKEIHKILDLLTPTDNEIVVCSTGGAAKDYKPLLGVYKQNQADNSWSKLFMDSYYFYMYYVSSSKWWFVSNSKFYNA